MRAAMVALILFLCASLVSLSGIGSVRALGSFRSCFRCCSTHEPSRSARRERSLLAASTACWRAASASFDDQRNGNEVICWGQVGQRVP